MFGFNDKIAMAPTVSLREFIRLLFPLNKFSHNQVSALKHWRKKKEGAYYFPKSSISLEFIIYKFIKEFNRPPILWLPAYYCEDALTETRRAGANLWFYPMTDTFDLDSDKILECRSFDMLPDYIVACHYFGRNSKRLEKLYEFAKKRDIAVIEDCTHLTAPIDHSDLQSAFRLYSLHKHFALPRGSVLVDCENRIDSSSEIEEFYDVLKKEVSKKKQLVGNLQDIFWFMKRLSQSHGFFIRHPPFEKFSWQSKAKKKKTRPVFERPGPFLLRLIHATSYQSKFAAEHNSKAAFAWRFLVDLICKIEGIKNKSFGQGDGFLTGFIFKKSSEMNLIVAKLKAMGLPCSTWSDIAPEVKCAKILYSRELNWCEKTFFLPCHKSVSLRLISGHIKKIARQYMSKVTVRVVSIEEWDRIFNEFYGTNLIQSPAFLKAKSKSNYGGDFYLLYSDDGNLIGGTAFLAKPFFGIRLIHNNRGPLLVGEYCKTPVDRYFWSYIFMEAMKKRKINGNSNFFPKLWSPEVDALVFHSFGGKSSFNRLPTLEPWGSAVIDLTIGIEEVRRRLKGKWRNSLIKAEKNKSLVISKAFNSDIDSKTLLNKYESFKSTRNFDGIPSYILKNLIGSNFKSNQIIQLICSDKDSNEFYGSVVVAISGDTATYLVGLSTAEGRKLQVNTLLLWKSVSEVCDSNIKFFDVGGLSKNTPSGIRSFKSGLSGDEYCLPGTFIL